MQFYTMHPGKHRPQQSTQPNQPNPSPMSRTARSGIDRYHLESQQAGSGKLGVPSLAPIALPQHHHPLYCPGPSCILLWMFIFSQNVVDCGVVVFNYTKEFASLLKQPCPHKQKYLYIMIVVGLVSWWLGQFTMAGFSLE